MAFPYTFPITFDTGYFVEVDWDNGTDFTGAYDDITPVVKSIHFSRGKSDELGKAEVGQLSVTLNNDDAKYTPSNSSSVLSGSLLPKRPIKVYYSSSGTNYPLFYGFIEEIIPHPHLLEQDCIITAVDGLDFLSRHDMSTSLYKDALTGTIHGYILTDAGWSTSMRTLDDGQDTVPYWYGSDVKARFAQEEIDDTEQGFSYVDGSGYFNFEDRHHRSTAEHQTVQATFNNTMTKATYSLNPRNIYNIIKVTVTPWSLQAITELWRLQETPSIPVGETLTWWGEASVSGESVFVDAWTTPVATTDYTANSQSDGGGTDITSDISIATTKLAKSIKLAITNNGTVPAFITLLKARGTYYDDQTKVTRKTEDSTSQTTYQKRSLIIDGKYMTDADKAQDFVNYAIGKYKDPRAQISITVMNKNATHLEQILTREISDRIRIINTKLGITNPITIGNEAISRSNTLAALTTWIDLANPVNTNATITSVDVWADTSLTGLRVGTFYLVSGTTYKCRDSELVGSVTGGSKQTFTVSISAQLGDYIGCYFDTGTILCDLIGGSGVAWVNGEYIDIDDSTSYSTGAPFGTTAMSLYGQADLGDDYFIDYMEHDISNSGLLHTVTYHLSDTINEDFWCLDYSALASVTTSGQTKLGY